jgi:hypothetical protein
MGGKIGLQNKKGESYLFLVWLTYNLNNVNKNKDNTNSNEEITNNIS